MEIMASPYKSAKDSPSRQLLWELGQLAISTQEGFYAHLDRESNEREALHQQALAAATAKHESVRRTAEQYRERLEEQIEAERKRRDDEEQRELEKLRREKVEQEIAERKRVVERAKTIELEEKRMAEVKRLEKEAADRRKAERERQDAETAKRQEEERKTAAQQKNEAAAAEVRAREAAVAAQKARSAPVVQAPAPISAPAPVPAPRAQQSSPTTQPIQNTQPEAEHSRYLEIHRALKEFRKFMTAQAKQNAQLKGAMGDMRREIKKSVGQLRDGKGANKVQLQTTIETLKKAATFAEPQVDITMFLASPPQIDDRNGPALLVYLLNIFAKAMIAQFISEAGVKPLIADNLGTVASHIFALDHFRWKGISLIDVLIAKFHVVCPVLFGIYGNEQTLEGKRRLGWWREEGGGAFVPEQRHLERMTGLGAGFAGISLKNYEKARAQNPYPDKHYWKSLAGITNVAPQEITQTHFVVLKGMIENFESKFLHFFGDAAIAALRLALIELPRRSPPNVAAKSLAGLVDVLKRDKKLIL